MPAVSCRSLTGNGTPRKGPSGSSPAAAASASSAHTVTNAFSSGFSRSIRSRHVSTSSTGVTSPLRSRSGRRARPLAPLLDLDRDHRPGRRPVAVLRVLGGQELHRPAILHDPRPPPQPHPPELRPVVFVVVDQHLDLGARVDVLQAL